MTDPTEQAHVDRCEVAIVGAGPAGLCAAIEAARSRASVTVIDEADHLGGQIYRPVPAAFAEDAATTTPDGQRGRALRDEARQLPIRFEQGTLVWGSFERGVLELTRGDRAWRLAADVVILATGAYDRPVPVPGWTLPGVLTVGGVQLLLKSQRLRPTGRVLLAGTGPLLLVVASQLAKAGVHPLTVVDPVPVRALMRQMPALVGAWPLLREGLSYHATLRRHGAHWIAPAILTSLEGDDRVRRATIARVDAAWRPVPGSERSLDVDTVAIGYGLLPSIDLARVCGCRIAFDQLAQAWVPVRDRDFQTSVPGIFAVGDGAGVAGALVAADEGRMAGLAAARLVGRATLADTEARTAAPRARLAKLARFRAAMDDVYRIRPGLYSLASPETTICRCEEVSRAAIDVALADGAASMPQVKAWTRAGMGACQGRMCALPTATLIAARRDQQLADTGIHPPGPIIKPVPIAALVEASKHPDE